MSSSFSIAPLMRTGMRSSPLWNAPAFTFLPAFCSDVITCVGTTPLRESLSLESTMLMTSSRFPAMFTRFTPSTESSSRRMYLAYLYISG